MDSTAPPEYPAFADALSRVGELAVTLLSEKRRAHAFGVAQTAADLCVRYGLDPEAGRLAGLSHDLCKEMPSAEQGALYKRYPGELPEYFYTERRFRHGPAAAVYLAENRIIGDSDILEAVAWHTTGRPGLGALGLVLYAADKLEPGRSAWRDPARKRLEAGEFDGPAGLNLLAAEVAALTMDYIKANGWPIAPGTLILYNALTGKSLKAWHER